jgi:hypothetical protein
MQNFRRMLTEASKQEPTVTWPETRWSAVLKEFCDWLNEEYREFLRASLVDSTAPYVRYLKLWPRGQRNASTTILSVYMTKTKARVLGKDTPEFKAVDEFQSYLAELLRLPAFRHSLKSFKELANQPVLGALRVGASWKAASLLADITVEVRPDQQHKLADASEATPPEKIERLYVQPVGPTPLGRATYPSKHKPIWLVSGGYVLEIEKDALESDGRIRLSGLPVPSDKLD